VFDEGHARDLFPGDELATHSFNIFEHDLTGSGGLPPATSRVHVSASPRKVCQVGFARVGHTLGQMSESVGNEGRGRSG
jgi:hypothetical protein